MEIAQDPARFGFVNVTEPARKSSGHRPANIHSEDKGVAAGAEDYLFFDDTYPTSR